MKKAFGACHFNTILISLRVGAVPISDFFRHCQYFEALRSFSTPD